MIAVFAFSLCGQHQAMQYCLLKKRAEDQALLRIEQLANEKERLDFECALERKLRLMLHALRRTEHPPVDAHSVMS